ncbi:MAG: hypothetical protein B6I20_12960 [Bacteroidetes bacterium 4572_117]|nr:MAG: hypothetical protein B6I20_12960 [Bacteroidetes bacterium 4572_117]
MLYQRGFGVVLCVFLAGFTHFFGQNESNLAKLTRETVVDYTEKTLGLDDLLVNGEKYQPPNIKVNKSPNFEWGELKGSKLFIKGELYSNIKLIYDISLDQLVLDNGRGKYIVLNSSYVDSFYLGYNHFIKLDNQKNEFGKFGYFEKINSKGDLLLKKYNKKIIKIYDSQNPDGRFSSQKYTYYIYNNNKLTEVDSKKAFLRYYGNKRKEIWNFLKKNKIKYRKASNNELVKLMDFCFDTKLLN